MTRGKKIQPPKLIFTTIDSPRYASLDEAWQVVGPLMAQLVAEIIKKKNLSQEGINIKR